ncbi:metallo-dependent phosphatase domain protein [Streptomyces phage BRock]|uniref:Metallo-dependent phosphatase domain protein n=1 Tax=Streptomyces phage BRock TaxID=1913591 RepID=A0A1J0GW60_9CAUD|nr:metallo-dependent phosphatase domain protein [Streptomyces phage BRock]APC46425.1 metallo-dependent phosphatase domain protein [Streptomyces phage BRock]
MKIDSIEKLRVVSQVNQDVFDILNDRSIGRKRASDLLTATQGTPVSEKLIRTWRTLQEATEAGYVALAESNREETEAEKYNREYAEAKTVLGHGNKYLTGELQFRPDVDLGGQAWRNIPDPVTPVKYERRFLTPDNMKKMSTRNKASETVLAFGDWQIDRHDAEVLDKAIQFAGDLQPDKLVLTGDECDNTSIGRHAAGTLDEVQSNLQDQIDQTVGYLTALRQALPNTRIIMAHSNHMNRFQQKSAQAALGYHTLRGLLPENIYELTNLGIEYWRKIDQFLPGYVVAHGHQFSFTSKTHLNQGAQVIKDMGVSLLAGHCHQAGMRTAFQGYEGKGNTLTYVNAGCMMDFDMAVESNGGYISGKSPDWSHGMVVIDRLHGMNFTNLLIAQNKTFHYEGVTY